MGKRVSDAAAVASKIYAVGEHRAALQHMCYLLAAIGLVSWLVRLRINRSERDLH